VRGERNSPPKLGGVAAPLRECREASLAAQTGWFGMGTTPPSLSNEPFVRSGTPPNLGGEFATLTASLIIPLSP
jgi:hypothetical protein